MTDFNRQGTEEEFTLKDTLLSKTPNQAEQWVENNVNDFASAKTLLKKMAKIIVVLAKNANA